jgi:hypothetical protein
MRMEGVSDEEAYVAAIGSILDISTERIPRFHGISAGMEWNAWLGSKLNLAAWEFSNFSAVPPGLWLLRIKSPYPAYDMHTLVMHGQLIVHDPHPEPQDIDLSDVGLVGIVLFPLDPSLPSGRLALD